MAQWLLTGTARVEWVRVNNSSPNEHTRESTLIDIWRTFTGMWSTNLHCWDAQFVVGVKKQRGCPEEWITELVWLNRMLVPIIKSNAWHGSCGMYIVLYVIGVLVLNKWKMTGLRGCCLSSTLGSRANDYVKTLATLGFWLHHSPCSLGRWTNNTWEDRSLLHL